MAKLREIIRWRVLPRFPVCWSQNCMLTSAASGDNAGLFLSCSAGKPFLPNIPNRRGLQPRPSVNRFQFHLADTTIPAVRRRVPACLLAGKAASFIPDQPPVCAKHTTIVVASRVRPHARYWRGVLLPLFSAADASLPQALRAPNAGAGAAEGRCQAA